MANKEKIIECLNRVFMCFERNENVSVEDVVFIRNNVKELRGCNKETLRDFVNKMLLQDNIELSLKILCKSGILFFAFPELERLEGLEQPSKYHEFDAFRHTLESVKYSEKDLVLRLTMLLHDIGKPDTYNKDEFGKITFYGHGIKGEKIASKMLARLGYDKNIVNEICMYIRHHMDYAPTEKSFNKMLKELENDIDKVDKLLKVKLYDSYASKGKDSELADNARNIDSEYRKILSKYKR